MSGAEAAFAKIITAKEKAFSLDETSTTGFNILLTFHNPEDLYHRQVWYRAKLKNRGILHPCTHGAGATNNEVDIQ